MNNIVLKRMSEDFAQTDSVADAKASIPGAPVNDTLPVEVANSAVVVPSQRAVSANQQPTIEQAAAVFKAVQEYLSRANLDYPDSRPRPKVVTRTPSPGGAYSSSILLSQLVAQRLKPREALANPITGLNGGQLQGGSGFPDFNTSLVRPSIKGKGLFVGNLKLFVRGVTYGTFRPNQEGEVFPKPEQVARDFAQIAVSGFNAIRTYTVPPRWLLDLAQANGIRLMIGLPWEQHVTFLDEPIRQRSIERRIRAGVRACTGHPAVLCYAIGNEVPAPIVRWYGSRSLERFLERLYYAAKAEDPGGLVTYVNYPSTEYLELGFVDLTCFNVYLESERAFAAYLARLHNLTGDRPLLLAELGFDSRRNSEATQARSLNGQVRAAMASGCAGAFVFAWTDEWHRGGCDVMDWDFGLTTRDRRPKPALAAVNEAFANSPFPQGLTWPRISVVVCTHNGGRTLRECLETISRLDYPEYEVIVVDDGSTDNSKTIASQYSCRLIATANCGLSSARNTGLAASSGEIVAYIDDDAYPDSHWLKYLALRFQDTAHCGIGGPNLIPPNDNAVAQCVGNAPGGPIHVLLTDSVAEHIPGCNMAFRTHCLRAIGGFDPQFRIAGDDVDVCWRLQAQGWTIGYSPAAVVWHHRRSTVRAYLKQQKGYGEAEALLQCKWPDKFNHAGHVAWCGRLYGLGLTRVLGLVNRVYHGRWGSAPFQMRHELLPGPWRHLPTMPEWLLIVLFLSLVSALGSFWHGLLWALPCLVVAVSLSVYQSVRSACKATAIGRLHCSARRRFVLRSLTALLHLLQPAARLWGRLRSGLVPGRALAGRGFIWPRRHKFSLWTEQWQTPESNLERLEGAIRRMGGTPQRGGEYDRWDLEVRGGLLASARLLMAVEEHGHGCQLARYRLWPRYTNPAWLAILAPLLLATGAIFDRVWSLAAVLAVSAILTAAYSLLEGGSAMGFLQRALGEQAEHGSGPVPVAVPAASAFKTPPSSSPFERRSTNGNKTL